FALKHRIMHQSVVSFFRGTYYRWAEAWPHACRETTDAPLVVAAGDVNLEGFSTWIDPEGRLGWGLLYLDDAYPLPYTNDLIRLMTSVLLALEVTTGQHEGFNGLCRKTVAAYAKVLAEGGSPIVLGAEHRWLRRLVERGREDPTRFWAKIHALEKAKRV